MQRNAESEIVFKFDESLSGYVYPGNETPEIGHDLGKVKNHTCEIVNTIEIRHMQEFTAITGRVANLVGTVSVAGLGTRLKIRKGEFTVFQIEEDPQTGITQKTMKYMIHFKSQSGEPYYLCGVKKLFYRRGKFEPLRQMTTLYTKIYKGNQADERRLFATGILRFHLRDLPSMLCSMRVEGTDRLSEKAETMTQFASFCYEEALEIYFNRLGISYRTDYHNLVLSGKCLMDGHEKHIFFYAGAHDQGFPWGDPQTFWDISLLFGDETGERVDRYLIARTELENLMDLEIIDEYSGDKGSGKASSRFFYEGKLYRLKQGYQVSFCDDLSDPGNSPVLEEVEARIEIDFEAKVPQKDGEDVPAMIVPFAIPEGLGNPLLLWLGRLLKKYAPSAHLPGIRLGIRSVTVRNANIRVAEKDVKLDTTAICGETEASTFNFVREPTLYYNYFCGISPGKQKVEVHVEGGVLYDDTTHYAKAAFDHVASSLVRPFSQMEVHMASDTIQDIDRHPPRVNIAKDFILEVNYEHFDTAVFQRRVVLLNDGDGPPVWALEEDMKQIRLNRILPSAQKKETHSPLDYERTRVAVYQSQKEWLLVARNPVRDRPGLRDNLQSLFNLNRQEIPGAIPEKRRTEMENHDKTQLLRKVVESSDFEAALRERAAALGKSSNELRIVIKPNFMFLYNKNDPTTYTDPVLVHALTDLMYQKGFTNIVVAEAHSTYGEYFENRDVASVANYIGLDGAGGKYQVVDLTQDEQVDPDTPFQGPLKGQKVPKTWADADFRIAFAKSKTHSYAYYTLTLKCIYGALPLANKFKEYHCDRGIYGTTIEYLTHYPLHFGFIDAYVGADGPFGIFADKTPNYTRTLIGGENLVAVDWIGASKMGYDPLVSPHMKLAVQQFGKPRIDLVGDLKPEIYSPWINIPTELSAGLNDRLDKHYQFGNIMYSALSNMDETAFPRKSDPLWMKVLRVLDKPFRNLFFIQTSPRLMRHLYRIGPFQKPGKKALDDISNGDKYRLPEK